MCLKLLYLVLQQFYSGMKYSNYWIIVANKLLLILQTFYSYTLFWNQTVLHYHVGYFTTKIAPSTYVITFPFRGNFELRPLGVAMGNVVSVTRVWSIHTKTPLVGRRQPMTSLPARPQYKGAPGKYVILFFVFNDCFVWSVQNLLWKR